MDEPDMAGLAARYGELRRELAGFLAGAPGDSPGHLGQPGGTNLARRRLATLDADPGRRLGRRLGHPETIRAGVDAGYLMAPYDSYQTAPSATENPDWTTAHLGNRAYRDCAIVLKDGKLKTGFQQSGHYTDPRCVRPLLEARVSCAGYGAGFNAWFLDAYATSMVLDSYRDSSDDPGAER